MKKTHTHARPCDVYMDEVKFHFRISNNKQVKFKTNLSEYDDIFAVVYYETI